VRISSKRDWDESKEGVLRTSARILYNHRSYIRIVTDHSLSMQPPAVVVAEETA